MERVCRVERREKKRARARAREREREKGRTVVRPGRRVGRQTEWVRVGGLLTDTAHRGLTAPSIAPGRLS